MKLIKTKSFDLAINTCGDEISKKLALLLPGRLDTKDYSNFTSHLEYLANKGFFTVALDPPGTWDSPGKVGLFTTTNYIKAVNELIESFGNKRTLLLGHSRGGQVASLVGTSNPTVAGFVLVNASYGPPSSPSAGALQSGINMEHRDLPPGDIKSEKQRTFALPINYFEDAKQYDPIPELKLCTKPKLIFYSTDDEFNDPEEVKEIYKNLLEPKLIHELQSAHDYRYNSKIINEVNEVIGQFLDDHKL